MKLKYIFVATLISWGMLSCNDLQDLNINPNQAEQVPAGTLLTTSIRGSMNSMVLESFLLGNNAAQLTAKTLRTEVDIYSWNAFPTVWESMYKSLANLDEMERLAIEEGNSNMEGVAIVLKSWIFSVLTDAYGDIPYREAVAGSSHGDFLPIYDTQESIYLGSGGLLEELERAEVLFGGNGTISGDIMFGGDADKWKKLCNSLRLRLLMRISNRADVAQEFQRIVNLGEIMTSNDDNAVLTYLASFPNEFPLIPLKVGDFDAVVMSQSSVEVMSNYRDPRLSSYARPNNLDFNNPTFNGAVNGSENPDICSKSGSRLGLAYFDYPGHPTTSTHGEGILMTYSEVAFLLAEASLKGWLSSDAAIHYKNGIQASMDYYEVDYQPFGYSGFEDYYSNSGVDLNTNKTIAKVWEQKWLSLFFSGLEPYFEVRRWMAESDYNWSQISFLTPTCENVNNDQLPLRFLYPGEEQSLNQINYSDAVSRIGSDTQNAKMWQLP